MSKLNSAQNQELLNAIVKLLEHKNYELIRKENLKDTQIIARSEFQRISALLAQIPEKYTRQGLYLSLQISS
ncbi:hypothetical protein, partial [Dendronalium sp. ChiSLP03b]|uniref:hypothetical protein n=1 Tax=Dendronalium sp. ChiSLP03b TaxID=3075381 RepID=UPI00391D9546